MLYHPVLHASRIVGPTWPMIILGPIERKLQLDGCAHAHIQDTFQARHFTSSFLSFGCVWSHPDPFWAPIRILSPARLGLPAEPQALVTAPAPFCCGRLLGVHCRGCQHMAHDRARRTGCFFPKRTCWGYGAGVAKPSAASLGHPNQSGQ
jgi:hypothetical protein